LLDVVTRHRSDGNCARQCGSMVPQAAQKFEHGPPS
jgi:hypothetical protein